MRRGRDNEPAQSQQVLNDLLSARITACVDHGEGSTIRLVGEAGIGKTTVANRMVQDALARGLNVAVGTSVEIHRALPFSSLQSAVTADASAPFGIDLGPHSIDDVVSPARVVPQAQRFAAIERVVDCAESFAASPALLVVEDLHWSDPASLEAIGAIARSALAHPLVLALTYRPGPMTPALSQLMTQLTDLGIHETPIDPLTTPEVADLVGRLSGGDPSQELIDWAHGAGGNPFLVQQFVNGLLAEGRLHLRDDQLHPDNRNVPLQLRDAIANELASAGDDVTAVVRGAAVIGTSARVNELADLLGASPVALAGPILDAITMGLLEEREQHLHFRHELLRDAVYQQMPTSVRMASHQALADVLSSRSAPVSLVATHLLLSGGSDEETVKLLQAAAATTAPIAPDSAIEFLDRARDLVGDLHTRIVIEQARLETLTYLGRLADAEGVAHWLLETAEQEAHPVLWSRLGGISTIAGDSARAITFLETARRLETNDYERCPMVALSAVACVANGQYLDAITLAEEAIELGQRTGHMVGESVGQALLGRIYTFANATDKGIELGSRAVALADRDPSGDAHWYLPCLHYGMTAFDLDRMDVADEMVAQGLGIANRLPISWTLPLYNTFAAAIHLRRGQLDQAAAVADTAVEQAERMTSTLTLSWAKSVLVMATLEIGELSEAQGWADSAAKSWAAGHNSMGIDAYALSISRVQRAAGDHRGAFETLSDEWDRFEAEFLGFCHPTIACELADVCLLLGETERFATVVDGVDRAAQANRVLSVEAKAKWIRARGDDDATAARAAHDRLRLSQHRFEVARWLAAAPELLAPNRDPAVALLEALTMFDTMGAVRSGALVREDLDRLGETAANPDSGWEALTPTELEIMRLLAEGSTNAQIAQERGGSRRTVESHLSRVYQKLNIEGRVKLTVAASEYFRSFD